MSLTYSIGVPSAVTTLALIENGDLLVGSGAYPSPSSLFGHIEQISDDGTVRMYSPSSTKVTRAVKSLGAELSSVCCCKPGGRQSGQWFCASGTRVFGFPQTPEKIILTSQDVSASFVLGEDEEDVLNEVSAQCLRSVHRSKVHGSSQIDLSYDGKYLAFSTDNGTVGVVELSTGRTSRMRTRHANVRRPCFLPTPHFHTCYRSAARSSLSLIDPASSSAGDTIQNYYIMTFSSVPCCRTSTWVSSIVSGHEQGNGHLKHCPEQLRPRHRTTPSSPDYSFLPLLCCLSRSRPLASSPPAPRVD